MNNDNSKIPRDWNKTERNVDEAEETVVIAGALANVCVYVCFAMKIRRRAFYDRQRLFFEGGESERGNQQGGKTRAKGVLTRTFAARHAAAVSEYSSPASLRHHVGGISCATIYLIVVVVVGNNKLRVLAKGQQPRAPS